MERYFTVLVLEAAQARASDPENLGRPPHRDVRFVLVFLPVLLLELEVEVGFHLSVLGLELAVKVRVGLLEAARGIGW